MSSLRFVCPNSQREIDSGVEIDAETFHKCRDDRVEVRCPACQEVHEFHVADGRIDELRVAS